jgi:DNA-binding PadR family transcriptional regulator
VPGEPVSFSGLKAATSLSDGNLHVQTRKLADVGYIEINKIKRNRRSVTEFRMTELGRERLRLHIVKLQGILDMEESPKNHKQSGGQPDDSMVWA